MALTGTRRGLLRGSRVFHTTFESMTGFTNLLGSMAAVGGYARGSALAADGKEILTNVEFSSDLAGWGNYNCTSTRVDSSIDPGVLSPAADKWCAKIIYTGASSSFYRELSAGILYAIYRVTGYLYEPSGSSGGRIAHTYPAVEVSVPSTDAWHHLTVTGTGATHPTIGARAEAGHLGDGTLYADGMSLQLTYTLAYHPFVPNATLNWGVVMPAALTTPRILPFRITDALNHWLVRILPNTAGTDCYLIERNAGVETTRASADVDWTAGATDEVRVIARGQSLQVYHRKSGATTWTLACQYTSASFNQYVDKHGIGAYNTSTDLCTYMRMVA